MEPVKGGTLASLPKEAASLLLEYAPGVLPVSYALRFAASLPGVFMVLSGMSSLEQVKDNIRIMDNPAPLNEGEKELLSKIVDIINSKTVIPCTSCGYCMEVCPKNINIRVCLGFITTIVLITIFQICIMEGLLWEEDAHLIV